MLRARGLPGAMQKIRRLAVGATMAGDKHQQPTHQQRVVMAGGRRQQRMGQQHAAVTSGERGATMISGGKGNKAEAASRISGSSKTPGGNLPRRRIAEPILGNSKALPRAARGAVGWKHLLRQVGQRKMLAGGRQPPTAIGSKRFSPSARRSLRVILDQRVTSGGSLPKIPLMSGAGQRQTERVNGASPLPVGGADAKQRPTRQSQPHLPGKRQDGGRLSRNSRPGRAADNGASSPHLPRARSHAASQNSLPPMRGGRVQAWPITGARLPRLHQPATAALRDKRRRASPLPRLMLAAEASGACLPQIAPGALSQMPVGVPRMPRPRGKRQKHHPARPRQRVMVQILGRWRQTNNAACLI
jgi:hypothetical protein